MSNSDQIKSIAELKLELGTQLISSDRVVAAPGVSTGWPQLDQFLLWKGFPKAAVSLLVSEAGGATTLWEQSAAQITKQGQWVAWVNGPTSDLTPWSLRQRNVDLSKLLYIGTPKTEKQTLWVLQELMSLCLFEMIGCDLGTTWLREHQVLQLKKLALRYQTALVLTTSSPCVLKSSFYAMIAHFHSEQVIIHRALHRPTPHTLNRKDLYADTLPQLAAGRRALCS